MTTLYVGNLPFSATEAEIRSLFEQHGKVDSVKIINDRTRATRGIALWTCRPMRRTASRERFEMNGGAARGQARDRPRHPRRQHRW
jgi:hypothetical protein